MWRLYGREIVVSGIGLHGKPGVSEVVIFGHARADASCIIVSKVGLSKVAAPLFPSF